MSHTQDLAHITQHFREFVHGKIEPEIVHAIETQLHTFTQEYTVSGAVGGALFYAHIGMSLTAPIAGRTYWSFDGDAGGLFSIAGSRLDGTLRSNDFPRMLTTTSSFYMNIVVPGPTSVMFFDGGHNLVGYFTGTAAGTLIGTGSGGGSWKGS